MNRWFLLVAIACLSVASLGCTGVKELGPANPDDTPTVSEQDIEQKIQQDMPEQYRKQYQR